MNKILLFLPLVLIISITPTKANIHKCSAITNLEAPEDSTRLAELDLYWAQLALTVQEGDFEGYGALYHTDAVVVFAGGENQTSVPVTTALAGWEKGFNDTMEGKRKDTVKFRLSQRIGDETTAHETGIFAFTSIDSNGNVKRKTFTHFEMLLIKKDNAWLALMEYQKSDASQEEWDALK